MFSLYTFNCIWILQDILLYKALKDVDTTDILYRHLIIFPSLCLDRAIEMIVSQYWLEEEKVVRVSVSMC